MDAEGCFSVIVEVLSPLKCKIRVSFEINLHDKDLAILYRIQSFFGVGKVYLRSERNLCVFRVTVPSDLLKVIIPHFLEYPLISKKGGDFILWSKVVGMVSKKDHLTKPGLLKILSYYASINRGVSPKVSEFFPDITPFDRPNQLLPSKLNPHWVSGFVAGDGGFQLGVQSDNRYVLGERAKFQFYITQHMLEAELFRLFEGFFGCGTVYIRSNSSRCDFIVQDLDSILIKVLPHFDLYPLQNIKQRDYLDFKEALSIINSGLHLTPEGIVQFKAIKEGMNSFRSS